MHDPVNVSFLSSDRELIPQFLARSARVHKDGGDSSYKDECIGAQGLRDRITLIEYEVAFIKGISTTNAPLPIHHIFQSIINHQFVPMPSPRVPVNNHSFLSCNFTIIGRKTSLYAPEFAFPPIVRAICLFDHLNLIPFYKTKIAFALAFKGV